MTKYINEKTLKSVFPNAYYEGFTRDEMPLTERHFKLLQQAVAEHKVRKDSVREVERFEYDKHKIKELHITGGAGEGYYIVIPYNRRQPKSRIRWLSDN